MMRHLVPHLIQPPDEIPRGLVVPTYDPPADAEDLIEGQPGWPQLFGRVTDTSKDITEPFLN